jgi:hypothetical protein
MTPFTPGPAKTVNIDVSSSTQIKQVTTTPAVRQIRVMNNGTATAWVEFGDSTVTASLTTSLPVGPGVTEVFTVKKADGPIYAAAIAAGSTGKVYFTPGQGI